MKKFIDKIFGGLEISWAKLTIFAVAMGVYTALMAMFAPDGSSFHDIAVTPEWWVLPAIVIIVNSKKPLEAALKTFVFFLISQPIVYLIQVPFNPLGWGIFGYYKYWFLVTLLTFPGAFVGWFIKKEKWYAGVILSVMTALLVFLGVNYFKAMVEHFPNHLLTVIYCFGIIPVLILGILKDKWARIITAVVSVLTLIPLVFSMGAEEFQFYTNTLLESNNIVLTDEAKITSTGGDGNFSVEMAKREDDMYVFTLTGQKGKEYNFTITDGEKQYDFVYYFDDELQTIVIKEIE